VGELARELLLMAEIVGEYVDWDTFAGQVCLSID
jgi:hypothetical protein